MYIEKEFVCLLNKEIIDSCKRSVLSFQNECPTFYVSNPQSSFHMHNSCFWKSYHLMDDDHYLPLF